MDKKGRNVINVNVREDVKKFYHENYSGNQSKILGALAEEFVAQVQRRPQLLERVIKGEFIIIEKS